MNKTQVLNKILNEGGYAVSILSNGYTFWRMSNMPDHIAYINVWQNGPDDYVIIVDRWELCKYSEYQDMRKNYKTVAINQIMTDD